MVVIILGLYHKAVLRIRAEAVLLIIIVKAVLYIRVEVTLDTEAVDPVATKTVINTGIVHHRVEILVIMINQGIQVKVKVTGHHILGVWNLHQPITMTDIQHHVTMIGAHHPLLMSTHLLLPNKREEVVDINLVGMIVTGVAPPSTSVTLLPLEEVLNIKKQFLLTL